jgi:hypothetical protein
LTGADEQPHGNPPNRMIELIHVCLMGEEECEEIICLKDGFRLDCVGWEEEY